MVVVMFMSLSGARADEVSQLKVSICLSNMWSSPRDSVSSPLCGLAPRVERKRRKHRRRSYGTDKSYIPPNSFVRSLTVSIPIHHYSRGHTECLRPEEDDSEDSDAPSTTMELLASKLEQPKQAKRVPQIIHLESHCLETEDSESQEAEPIIEVADYSSEVNVQSVCSDDDMTRCLKVLSDLHNSLGVSEAASLDVGNEVELGELSQESGSSGMELLNLRKEQRLRLSTETIKTQSSRETQCCTYATFSSDVHSQVYTKCSFVHSVHTYTCILHCRSFFQKRRSPNPGKSKLLSETQVLLGC